MDATSDLVWPAVLFTVLAIIVAAVSTRKSKAPAPLKRISQTAAAVHEGVDAESSHSNDTDCRAAHHSDTPHQSNANSSESTHDSIQQLVQDCTPDHEDGVCREDLSEYGIRNALKDYAQSPDAEDKPLRYMAGMLRSIQLEKMMTKEELEEEQRIQREQLAAIFQLLRDKQETFGDVTEHDLEEQLKLYST